MVNAYIFSILPESCISLIQLYTALQMVCDEVLSMFMRHKAIPPPPPKLVGAQKWTVLNHLDLLR